MTRQNIPLGRILGIPVGLDYSWFLIFALFTWSLAESYYPAEFKNWPPLLYWFIGALTAIWEVFSGNIGGGLWTAFIGWFLDNAASAQVHQVVFQGLLAGHKFRRQ